MSSACFFLGAHIKSSDIDMMNLYIVAPDAHISACLETSQATQSLQLSDLALSATQLAPLFRALNRQHTLQQLHLAGNCFSDDGVKVRAHEQNKATRRRGDTVANTSDSMVFLTVIHLIINYLLLLQNKYVH
jgi:hypothetical protein